MNPDYIRLIKAIRELNKLMGHPEIAEFECWQSNVTAPIGAYRLRTQADWMPNAAMLERKIGHGKWTIIGGGFYGEGERWLSGNIMTYQSLLPLVHALLDVGRSDAAIAENSQEKKPEPVERTGNWRGLKREKFYFCWGCKNYIQYERLLWINGYSSCPDCKMGGGLDSSVE